MSMRKHLCGAVVGLVAAALLTGCGGSQDSKESRYDPQALVGRWVEDPTIPASGATDAKITVPTRTMLRELVVKADHTYTWTVCDLQLKPLDPPQVSSGKWEVSKGVVRFAPTTQQMTGDFEGNDPESCLMVRPQAHNGKDTVTVRDNMGNYIGLSRAEDK